MNPSSKACSRYPLSPTTCREDLPHCRGRCRAHCSHQCRSPKCLLLQLETELDRNRPVPMDTRMQERCYRLCWLSADILRRTLTHACPHSSSACRRKCKECSDCHCEIRHCCRVNSHRKSYK